MGLTAAGGWLRIQAARVVSGLWGAPGPIQLHRAVAQGGGMLAMELDCPLDHAVVFATAQACSAEPKIVHVLTQGDHRMAWSITYRA